MKPYHAIIVFAILVCSSALSSVHSYRTAADDIVKDMNQALARTLETKQEGTITLDTIQDYRSHLRLAELRDKSFIYYALGHPTQGLHSDKMEWRGQHRAVSFQGYANCSMASVWMMSDQKMPLALSVMALLWMGFAIAYFKKYRQGLQPIGQLFYSMERQSFLDADAHPIRFTPMQHQLMMMFCEADDRRLDKQQICDQLWPKKPDASETLYTLVARLKPIIEKKGHLQIVSDRGRGYELREID